MKRSVDRDYLQGWLRLIRLLRQGRSFSGRERNCCFLNTGQTRFAGVSSVSGLDFPDDGRACAVVDWDRDGQQDLWLTNRTSPRVRVMRNVNRSGNHWLAVKLEGRDCNRDAIGARVTVEFSVDDANHGFASVASNVLMSSPKTAPPTGNQEPRTEKQNSIRLAKTVRAGEGFLSQSSKWLHFGLAGQPTVDRLIVHWPDGTTSEFQDLSADSRYRIIQGNDQPMHWTYPRERPQLLARYAAPQALTDKTRVVMALPPSLSGLIVDGPDGVNQRLSDLTGGMVMIHFWRTSCVACLEELTQWTEDANRFREAGLSVLAVHMDSPKSDTSSQRRIADEFLQRIEFPFASADLPTSSLATLDKFLKKSLQRHIRFSLPLNILLQADGSALVIYKGPVDVDQLLKDTALAELDSEALFEESLPFSGRWLTKPDWNAEL